MVNTVEKILSRIAPPNERGCMEWTGAINGKGYGQVGLHGRVFYVHRLAYESAKGDATGLHVCHACDNPKCCNPEHLWLGTHADNHADKASKGRTGKEKRSGELNVTSKLTEQQVREILASDETGGSLARKFGVTRANVNAIRRRETWRHLNV